MERIEEIMSQELSKQPKCPLCGGPVGQATNSYFCQNVAKDDPREKCTFYIPKVFAGKKITEAMAYNLMTKKETGFITGFKKKDGTPFSTPTKLVLKIETNEESGKLIHRIEFLFDDPSERKKDLKGKCPYCGGAVTKTKYVWKCEKDCGLRIPYSFCGKSISEEIAETLLRSRRTGYMTGFKRKDKTAHPSSALVLNDEKEIRLEYEDLGKDREDIYSKCRYCGSNVIKGRFGWECEKKCGLLINYIMGKKEITPEIASALNVHGATVLLYGFISKKGKPFNAYLVMDDETKRPKYVFPERET